MLLDAYFMRRQNVVQTMITLIREVQRPTSNIVSVLLLRLRTLGFQGSNVNMNLYHYLEIISYMSLSCQYHAFNILLCIIFPALKLRKNLSKLNRRKTIKN